MKENPQQTLKGKRKGKEEGDKEKQKETETKTKTERKEKKDDQKEKRTAPQQHQTTIAHATIKRAASDTSGMHSSL